MLTPDEESGNLTSATGIRIYFIALLDNLINGAILHS